MTTMMGMGVGFLIVLSWGGLMVWASVLAFRGKRYWATWLMLVGSSLQLIGGLCYIGGLYFVINSLSAGPSGPSPLMMPILMMSMYGLFFLGLLLTVAGMLGVCSRFGSVEKRAAELEALNLQLQERLQE